MRDNGARAAVFALAATVLGCSEESAPPAAATAASSAVAAPRAPSPLVEVEAPSAVHAFGGLRSSALAAALTGAEGVVPEELAARLARQIGLADGSLLDAHRPGYFAVVERGDGTDDTVLLLPVTSAEAFATAVDGTSVAPGRWTRRGGGVHLGHFHGWIVASSSPELVADLAPFWERLAGAELEGDGQLVLETKHALAGHPEGTTSVGHAVARLVDRFGLGRVEVQLASEGGGWDLELRLAAPAGLEGVAPLDEKARVLREIPAEALAVAVARAEAGALATTLAAWWLQLTRADDDALAPALDAFVAATSGDLAFFATPTRTGVQLAGVAGVRDADALRQAQRKLHQSLRSPAARAVHADLGVVVNVRRDSFQLEEQPVDVVETVLAPGRPRGHDLEQAFGATATSFANLMTTHVTVGPEVARVTYGVGGKAYLEAWPSDHARSFASGEVARGLLRDPAPFLLGTFDVVGVGKAASREPPADVTAAPTASSREVASPPRASAVAAASASAAAPVSSRPPVTLAARAEPSRVRVSIHVPRAQLAAISSLFRK